MINISINYEPESRASNSSSADIMKILATLIILTTLTTFAESCSSQPRKEDSDVEMPTTSAPISNSRILIAGGNYCRTIEIFDIQAQHGKVCNDTIQSKTMNIYTICNFALEIFRNLDLKIATQKWYILKFR